MKQRIIKWRIYKDDEMKQRIIKWRIYKDDEMKHYKNNKMKNNKAMNRLHK